MAANICAPNDIEVELFAEWCDGHQQRNASEWKLAGAFTDDSRCAVLCTIVCLA